MDWNFIKDMTEDFASGWLTTNTYNILTQGGWRVQVQWLDYAASGENATIKIYGSVSSEDEPQILIDTITITTEENAEDNLFRDIKYDFSKIKLVYSANTATAGNIHFTVRKAR